MTERSSGARARRAVLSTPASEPRRIAKALALDVDEVVVDLEDAVAPGEKDAARANIAAITRRDRGAVAVRVNAIGTSWHEADLVACVAQAAVETIVLPKAEDPEAIAGLAARLADLEAERGRSRAIGIQALIESPLGVARATEVALASDRLVGLIIGYADLSASMGRRVEASWQFAQDAVVLAARVAGLQAIDGPVLTVAADGALEEAAHHAESLGFDGKWVIHPAQVPTVRTAFTPTDDDVAEAREILAALAEAEGAGRGAVQWRGRMLDEAVAVRARRTLDRVTTEEIG